MVQRILIQDSLAHTFFFCNVITTIGLCQKLPENQGGTPKPQETNNHKSLLRVQKHSIYNIFKRLGTWRDWALGIRHAESWCTMVGWRR